ncbi:3-phosphoglycerate dehydrogenase [Candidatus Poribacteria bacterium]|nr:3-phosphoglycerate dehydrogenase [Candidatus Poribacteria bacterium]
MEKLTIVVPGDSPPQIQDSVHLDRLKPYGDVVVYTDRPESIEEKIKRAENADILINSRGLVKWNEDVLPYLPRLKLISLCSIGTDMIALDVAKKQGIVVCNQPGRTAPVVAEHGFGLMFALSKRAAFMTASLKDGNWPRMDNVFLQGKTLGIIGTGHIGSEMARLGIAIGMNVVAWTYNPSDKRGKDLGIQFVDFEDLLRISDVVSLHVKLTDDSFHLIGEYELSIMKPGVLIVNVSRGQVIDVDALIKALNGGHIGGAALDVYEQEPLPENHPLLTCEQVILTPHCADMTPEGVDLLNEGAVDNIIAFLNGTPINVVV